MSVPTFESGSSAKSDCRAVYLPGESALEIGVKSSVAALFGRAIETTARRVAAEFGVSKGRLYLVDDGALDYVLSARVEAVLRLAGFGLLNGAVRASQTVGAAAAIGGLSARRSPYPRNRSRSAHQACALAFAK